MNHVFDRYRAPGMERVSSPESWSIALTGRFYRPFYLREGGRPAPAAEGLSQPAAPGQEQRCFSVGGASSCTDRTAEEGPKEQAGFVPDEWAV